MLSACSYHRPTTLDEALALADRYGSKAKILAGGTDLVLKMRAGELAPAHLIDIGKIGELDRIENGDAEGLVIGACARLSAVGHHRDVESRYPALSHACRVMATTQIRNMGTVAGNLANGSPCADTAGPLLVYDAHVVLATSGGRRQVRVDQLFLGPGQVDIEPAEILERVVLPAPHQRMVSAYLRLSARSEVDMAAAGVAGCLVLDENGRIASARLAMSAVAPTPMRCPEAEQVLVGQLPEPAVLERCARTCADAARPIDDVRASAAYRRAIVSVLARRVLESCLAQGRGRTT